MIGLLLLMPCCCYSVRWLTMLLLTTMLMTMLTIDHAVDHVDH